VTAFVRGGDAPDDAGLGMPEQLGATMLAVMAILFAATTMDTGLRLQRYVVQEAGEFAGLQGRRTWSARRSRWAAAWRWRSAPAPTAQAA
jgi:carbon starvation protein CstA